MDGRDTEIDGRDWDGMVLVGLVARPHGLRGYVVVNPQTDFPESRFAAGQRMWLGRPEGREALVVASARMQGGRPVVRFEGFDRIEDVEGLAGCELRVAEQALQPLPAGQYYQHQLAGCAVETLAGDHVGTVLRVEGGSSGSRLVVIGDRGEVLIPLAEAICPEIDVQGRRIRIDPPDGLIELNVK